MSISTQITPETSSAVLTEVDYGSPIHDRITGWYIREARLLDHRLLDEWQTYLAEDLVYKAPVRLTRRVQGFDTEFGAIGHFDDDHASMTARVKRLTGTKSAWSEDPASRTRRFVTNISIWETDIPDEYKVSSYLLLTRNRADAKDYKQLSAERNDRLRWNGERFLLSRRTILLDQVVLGMPNLAIFL
ncbi:3-phenylpropionate/cinnamic acid dioxygenase small subunit [Sphingobium fontiphilum]|uniref:3-phenylpropionate/cinnamic acid dioxygenase small subunit n=1 Tax=Sphingobium fontiphilum TaxID=944425 RepID=A0A7W6GQ05_9SPHN|nr:3-phenylpropionate/cinnamic acid dioxygenase subunit beta [Sphingobium fontiphilum]MBB3983087.1 3-phenylpropionate/cinnamic acid dioxygenase small subunit [Sphingobium fontiphilum]